MIPRSEDFCANIGGDSGSGGEGGGDGGSEGDEGFCTGKADGIYSDPEDNTKFYQCAGRHSFPPQHRMCHSTGLDEGPSDGGTGLT